MQTSLTISRFQNSLLLLAFSIIGLYSCDNKSQPASQAASQPVVQPEVRLNDTSAILTRFNFEHFGSFDLSTWKLMPKIHQGDVVLDVTSYSNDSLQMDVKESAMGEGMYFLTYELKGRDGKVMRTRDLSFTTASDAESEKLPVTLTETVRDYTVNPPKQFERIQKTDKLYRELKPLPTAATGAWVESVTEPYFYPEQY